MQYTDLLRGAVFLAAVEGTLLGVISAIVLTDEGSDLLAALAFGWFVVAIGLGLYLGTADRAREALRDPLASARTATQLPAATPARIAAKRLWPIFLFAVVAGGLGAIFPQVPAIGAGAALLVALAWRKREAAVTAIEERDGVCFYVDDGSAFEPIKLLRTPGLMRGASHSAHPPPAG